MTDLLIGAMVQFEHKPAMRSVLTGTNAATQFTGEKKIAATSQQDLEKLFLKIGPCRKLGVCPHESPLIVSALNYQRLWSTSSCDVRCFKT
jgi:hypothetical protein